MGSRVRIAWTRHDAPRAHLVVRADDDHGHHGEGEIAPLPGFARDDVGACARALARLAAGDLHLRDDLRPSGAVRAALAGFDVEDAPSARFGLEHALLAMLAARRGVSLAELLASDDDRAHAPLPAVLVNAMLLPDPLATLADRAVACAQAGYASVKIKLRARERAAFEAERAALLDVRRSLPLPFEIRLDANGAWSLDEARQRLDALALMEPAYVEQPVAPAILPELGACAVPWAADESLARPELVDALLAAPGCAAFVLKPVILGLLGARDIALRAQARGLGVVVTHALDGPRGMTAAAALALSLPRPPLACGLGPHEALDAFVHEHPSARPPRLERTPRGVVIAATGVA